jgi:hypothetical protein
LNKKPSLVNVIIFVHPLSTGLAIKGLKQGAFSGVYCEERTLCVFQLLNAALKFFDMVGSSELLLVQ